MKTSENNHISWNSFEQLFRDNGTLLVGLNWEHIKHLPVTTHYHATIPEKWFTVWYAIRNETGIQFAEYRDSGAYPLDITQASDYMATIDPERDIKIDSIAHQFRIGNSTEPDQIVVWRTPNSRTVILDGNHRAVASLRNQGQASSPANDSLHAHSGFQVFAIHGSDDASLLPDLIHHRG